MHFASDKRYHLKPHLPACSYLKGQGNQLFKCKRYAKAIKRYAKALRLYNHHLGLPPELAKQVYALKVATYLCHAVNIFFVASNLIGVNARWLGVLFSEPGTVSHVLTAMGPSTRYVQPCKHFCRRWHHVAAG